MHAFSHHARGLAVAALIGLTGAPALAQAQSDPNGPPPDSRYSDGRYDATQEAYQAHQACESQKTNHAVAGALIGGVLGAVVGSQVSGHGARTEGSVLGGGGGALAGAAIGSSSTHCDGPPADAAYAPPPPPPAYYAPPPPPVYYAPPPPVCEWARDVLYMPDGSQRHRQVHVCQDDRGRWQVAP
ncbi:glycine zipper 2TM domain-containing protein [Caulobacter sp. KR2-114]|uniref:glycine zipper 2TM domain-containing protein n=1 Tax=Caulobacter sp. KR2-114 TaxID=3400912 RepID=UPI003BFE8DBA